jgi:hypothetical protein
MSPYQSLFDGFDLVVSEAELMHCCAWLGGPARRRNLDDAHIVEGALLLWFGSLLRLLGHTEAKHLPLETVLGRELAKVMRVQ